MQMNQGPLITFFFVVVFFVVIIIIIYFVRFSVISVFVGHVFAGSLQHDMMIIFTLFCNKQLTYIKVLFEKFKHC